MFPGSFKPAGVVGAGKAVPVPKLIAAMPVVVEGEIVVIAVFCVNV